jgi:hypothetical protein
VGAAEGSASARSHFDGPACLSPARSMRITGTRATATIVRAGSPVCSQAEFDDRS